MYIFCQVSAQRRWLNHAHMRLLNPSGVYSLVRRERGKNNDSISVPCTISRACQLGKIAKLPFKITQFESLLLPSLHRVYSDGALLGRATIFLHSPVFILT